MKDFIVAFLRSSDIIVEYRTPSLSSYRYVYMCTKVVDTSSYLAECAFMVLSPSV